MESHSHEPKLSISQQVDTTINEVEHNKNCQELKIVIVKEAADIESSTIHKSSYEELKRVSERLEKKSNNLEKRSINLAGYYVFFQTIILVAVSQPSSSLVNHQWIPFCASFSVAIIFGVTFTSTLMEWERSKYYFDLNWLEQEIVCLRRYKNQNGMENERLILNPDKFAVYQRYAFVYTTLIALLSFTVFIFYACFKFL